MGNYIEIDKEFNHGSLCLYVTFGATVHRNGDVEGHVATVSVNGRTKDITECFTLSELNDLNEEFISESMNQ